MSQRSTSQEAALRYRSIARWVAWGALLLAFLVPLIVADSLFFPYITGKNFTFRFLVEVAFVAWLVLALTDPRYRPRWSLLLVAFTGFVGWMALADALAPNAFKAFVSNFERMEGWIGLLHTYLFFVVLTAMAQGEAQQRARWDWWWVVWHTSMAVAVVVALGAVGDYLAYLAGTRTDPRVFSTLGNATYLAAYSLFHIFIAFFYLVRERRTLWRAGYGLFIALQSFALYHTATRGALLGLVGGLVLTSLLWAFGSRKPLARWGALLLLGAIGLVVGGFLMVRESPWVQESPVLKRFASISLSEGTVAARLMIWQMALEGARERPFFGWGQEGFNYVFNKHYDPRMYNQEQWFDRAHNAFLDWLIAGGIPAFLLHLSLYGIALWFLWGRRGREEFSLEERAVLTGLLAAYGFHNLFVFDNLTSYLLFATFLAWVNERAAPLAPRVGGEEPASDAVVQGVIFPIVLLVILLMMVYHSIGLASASQLVRAVAQPNLSAKERASLLQRAYHFWGIGSQEVAEQAMQIAQEARAKGDPAAPKLLSVAESLLAQELQRAPYDARLLFFYAATLEGLGRTAEAEQWYERALAASPRKQIFLAAYASFLINQGRLKEAATLLRRAYDLAPENDEAARNLAAVLILQEKEEEARSFLFQHTGGDAQQAETLFVEALKVIGRWEEAARLQEAHLSPTSSLEEVVAAAQLWLLAGKRDRAEAIIRQWAQWQPQQASTATMLLQQIEHFSPPAQSAPSAP